jgi:hypothetical protein
MTLVEILHFPSFVILPPGPYFPYTQTPYSSLSLSSHSPTCLPVFSSCIIHHSMHYVFIIYSFTSSIHHAFVILFIIHQSSNSSSNSSYIHHLFISYSSSIHHLFIIYSSSIHPFIIYSSFIHRLSSIHVYSFMVFSSSWHRLIHRLFIPGNLLRAWWAL